MKDFIGNSLEIGDTVALLMSTATEQVSLCTIKGFDHTKEKIWVLPVLGAGKVMFKRYPNNMVKVSIKPQPVEFCKPDKWYGNTGVCPTCESRIFQSNYCPKCGIPLKEV